MTARRGIDEQGHDLPGEMPLRFGLVPPILQDLEEVRVPVLVLAARRGAAAGA